MPLKEEKELPPSVVPGYISSGATCGEWSRLSGREGASSLRRAAPVSDQLCTVTCCLPSSARSLSGCPAQVSSRLSRAPGIRVATRLPTPQCPGSSGAPAARRVRASARRAVGCRCWASWSPRSLPAPGGPWQLGRELRVRQQG